MNKGIKYSTGDYLIFLNAGDEFYDHETLELVNYQLNISDADVLFGGADIYFNRDHFIYRPPLNINECISFSLPGHHQATYYSKKILNKIQYPLNVKENPNMTNNIKSQLSVQYYKEHILKKLENQKKENLKILQLLSYNFKK